MLISACVTKTILEQYRELLYKLSLVADGDFTIKHATQTFVASFLNKTKGMSVEDAVFGPVRKLPRTADMKSAWGMTFDMDETTRTEYLRRLDEYMKASPSMRKRDYNTAILLHAIAFLKEAIKEKGGELPAGQDAAATSAAPQPASPWLGTKEAAAFLGLSEGAVEDLIRRRILRVRSVEGRRLVSRLEAEAFIPDARRIKEGCEEIKALREEASKALAEAEKAHQEAEQARDKARKEKESAERYLERAEAEAAAYKEMHGGAETWEKVFWPLFSRSYKSLCRAYRLEERLTPREITTLDGLLQLKTLPDIAAGMNVNEEYVKDYVAKILALLNKTANGVDK